jgi:hypothetical protein
MNPMDFGTTRKEANPYNEPRDLPPWDIILPLALLLWEFMLPCPHNLVIQRHQYVPDST